MSESPLTATQFFVLALASLRESTTMYELELRAGLSSGGVKHVVSSLERAGWISRQPSGIRRRRDLIPTPEGRRLLKTSLPEILAAAEFEDFPALVRVAWSLMQLDAEKGGAFLERAATRRDEYAGEQIAELSRLPASDTVMSSYKRTALRCQAERLRCEAAILRRLAANSEALNGQAEKMVEPPTKQII